MVALNLLIYFRRIDLHTDSFIPLMQPVIGWSPFTARLEGVV